MAVHLPPCNRPGLVHVSSQFPSPPRIAPRSHPTWPTHYRSVPHPCPDSCFLLFSARARAFLQARSCWPVLSTTFLRLGTITLLGYLCQDAGNLSFGKTRAVCAMSRHLLVNAKGLALVACSGPRERGRYGSLAVFGYTSCQPTASIAMERSHLSCRLDQILSPT